MTDRRGDAMDRQLGDDAGDGEQRITRRAAIASGAAAYGAGALWASTAFARGPGPAQLLLALHDEIRSSHVASRLRSRLLTIVSDAASHLEHGQNVHARAALEQQLVPLLEHSSQTHALPRRQAKRWVDAAHRISSEIPHHDAKLGVNRYGGVTVFNCHNEAVSGLTVAGGLAGNVAGWSLGGAQTPYTPAGLVVPRSLGPNPGQFAIGDNALTLPWDSFTGSATITIPDPRSGVVSLLDDLILFAALNQAVLLSARGTALATFPVKLTAP
jgi:hypothetical protein